MKRTKSGAGTSKPKAKSPQPAKRVARPSRQPTRAKPRTAAPKPACPQELEPPRRAPGIRRSLVVPAEERQRADPLEAALEDLKALPEPALFDTDDDLAEMLGEEYLRSVCTGEEQGVEFRDELVPEEEGGPFLETSGHRQFSHSPDDAEPEPLPLVNRAPSPVLRGPRLPH